MVVCKPILVFSLSQSQAEQLFPIPLPTTNVNFVHCTPVLLIISYLKVQYLQISTVLANMAYQMGSGTLLRGCHDLEVFGALIIQGNNLHFFY